MLAVLPTLQEKNIKFAKKKKNVQILREIKFEQFRSSKTVVFAIFGALNLFNFSFQIVQKLIKIKI